MCYIFIYSLFLTHVRVLLVFTNAPHVIVHLNFYNYLFIKYHGQWSYTKTALHNNDKLGTTEKLRAQNENIYN